MLSPTCSPRRLRIFGSSIIKVNKNLIPFDLSPSLHGASSQSVTRLHDSVDTELPAVATPPSASAPLPPPPPPPTAAAPAAAPPPPRPPLHRGELQIGVHGPPTWWLIQEQGPRPVGSRRARPPLDWFCYQNKLSRTPLGFLLVCVGIFCVVE